MAIHKCLASALSLASVALAASCGGSDTLTASAPAAVSSIAACSTYSGNIVLESGVATGGKLDFGNIQKIDGDLSYGGDDQVEQITAGSLEEISGTLNLTTLVHLSTLTMTSLSQVGNMTLQNLGALNQFDFGTPGIKKIGRIVIQNTQLARLDGLDSASEIEALVISDNTFLQPISLDIETIGAVDIGPNNVVQGQQASFPKLANATFLNFRNCSQVNVPSLESVSTILGLYGNTFESFSAPNVTYLGGLVVDDNSKLSNLSFPELASINSSNATLQIANNSALRVIDGFPKLTNIKGNVDISGNVDEIDFNKTIKQVAGAFDVDTSSDTLKCDDINGLGDNQVVRGHVNCKSQDDNPTSTNGDGTTDTSGGSSSSSSSGAAVPLDIPTYMAGTGLIAGLLSLLL